MPSFAFSIPTRALRVPARTPPSGTTTWSGRKQVVLFAYGDPSQEFATHPEDRLSPNSGARSSAVSRKPSAGEMLARKITATESRQGTVYFLAGAELQSCESNTSKQSCDIDTRKATSAWVPSAAVRNLLHGLGASADSGNGRVFIVE